MLLRSDKNAMRLTAPASFRVVLADRLVQFTEKTRQRGLNPVPIRNQRRAERVFEKGLRRNPDALDERGGCHFLFVPVETQPVDGRVRGVLPERVLSLAHVSA